MIRLRKQDGTTTEIPQDQTFVELVNDLDGSVMLAFAQLQPGALMQIAPGTSDAARYEQIFAKQGVVFSKTMIVREPK